MMADKRLNSRRFDHDTVSPFSLDQCSTLDAARFGAPLVVGVACKSEAVFCLHFAAEFLGTPAFCPTPRVSLIPTQRGISLVLLILLRMASAVSVW